LVVFYFDVIVVGAGPAGCAAAYDLAAGGLKVLLLDHRSFPRVKPCAGALTIKTVEALRYDVSPVVRAVAKGIRASRDLAENSKLHSKQPICLMTVRSELDEFCLAKTRDAGAHFRVIGDLTAIEEHANEVKLGTAESELRARFLIGADGANSRVRLLLGDQPWFRRALAIEAHAPVHTNAQPMELDFGVVPRGYGWSFHKGDHLNVGLYTEARGVKLTRAMLAGYLRRKFGSEQHDQFVGHYLGTGGLGYTPQHARIFLVGDAAGMTDPLSGEGICNAVKSGQAAAAAILQSSIAPQEAYARGLANLHADLAFCERATGKFYGHLKSGFTALRMPGIKRALMNGYALGMTLSAIRSSILTLPFATVEEKYAADPLRVISEA
jgi:geranylgeranyl reductase family protein